MGLRLICAGRPQRCDARTKVIVFRRRYHGLPRYDSEFNSVRSLRIVCVRIKRLIVGLTKSNHLRLTN